MRWRSAPHARFPIARRQVKMTLAGYVSVSRGFGEGKADLRAWTALTWEASDATSVRGRGGHRRAGIAPHVASKVNDPAVVAIDEAGRVCRPAFVGAFGRCERA